MDTIATVEIAMQLNPNAQLRVEGDLEVSLDCPVCRRIHRTVVFSAATPAYCTPTRHSFPGKLITTTVTTEDLQTLAVYTIQYETGAFVDPKYHYPSVRHPTWARVYFRIRCSKCGAAKDCGFQNNVSGPFTESCRCGPMAVSHAPELPVLQAYDAHGVHLYSVNPSTYELFVSSLDGAAPESQRLLSALSGTPCDVLAERARQGRPVCTLQKYRNSQGLTYFDIEVVLNALTCDRVLFELRDTGRPIRPRRD